MNKLEIFLQIRKLVYSFLLLFGLESLSFANDSYASNNLRDVKSIESKKDSQSIPFSPPPPVVKSSLIQTKSHDIKLAENEATTQTTTPENITPENTTIENTQKSSTTSTSGTNSVAIEKVVTTARGTEQNIKDAPASISVISGEELMSRPARSLAEALADIPGLDIEANLSKTGNLDVAIRGLDSSYTMILIDGKRQNVAGAITQNNISPSIFIPPLAAIERVEIIRGPMSTLYGSDALGGVINIITKKKIDKFATNITLETVQNENREYGPTYIGSLFTTIPIIKNVLGLQLRGRYLYRQQSDVTYHYTATTASPDGTIPAGSTQRVPVGFSGSPTQTHNYDVGGRLLYNPNDANHIYFDFEHAMQWYDNSKGQMGTLWSIPTSGNNANKVVGGYLPTTIFWRNNAILAHKGQYDWVRTDTSLQVNHTSNEGRVVTGDPNLLPLAGQSREIMGIDMMLDHKSFLDLPFNNYLTIGGNYWYSYHQDRISQQSPFHNNNIALFIEDEWEALDNLRFTLGVREDWNQKFGFHTSPKAYIVYDVLPNWLTIKGGVSMGYKAPNLNQLVDAIYGVGSQGQQPFFGNPNLKPEQSLSGEVTILSNNEYLDIGATYFYTYFWDKITTQAIQGANTTICEGYSRCSRATNVDKSSYQGVEAFVNTKPFYGVTLDLSYTFIDSEQLSGTQKGKPLSNTLSHKFTAKLGYTWKNLHVYVRGEYIGPRYRGETDNAVIAAVGEYYKHYGLMHLGASYRISKNFKLNFAVYNVLDHDFSERTQYAWTGTNTPQIAQNYNALWEGRRYWISLNMDF